MGNLIHLGGNITLWWSTAERVKRPQTFSMEGERCPRGADDVADIEIPSMLLAAALIPGGQKMPPR